MNDAFEKPKLEIVQAVSDGVCKYKKGRWTALMLDWSKLGVGFIFSQKHCLGPGECVGCCQSGFRVTFVGSRF